MARATRFLAAGMAGPGDAPPRPAPPRPIEGTNRARVIGNGLRELDRFLNILIDEVAATATIAVPGLDPGSLARQRNTANKLDAVRGALCLPHADTPRLRAIGRLRDCLYHTAGIVRRTDGRTIGGHDGRPAYRPGERIAMTVNDLAAICAFYDRLATDLVADSIAGARRAQAPEAGPRLAA